MPSTNNSSTLDKQTLSIFRTGFTSHLESEACIVAQLAIGMDLQQCLDLLGAPTSVRRDDEGIRTVLSWEWLEAGGYGLSLSVPLSEQASASVDYGTDSQQFRQIQVFLDTQLKVVDVSRDRTR